MTHWQRLWIPGSQAFARARNDQENVCELK
jgi:hypothetical protein